MDLTLIALAIIYSIILIYFYFCLSRVNEYVEGIAKLVKRTFVEYYKEQDIEPIVIYNGIALKWNGEVNGIKTDNDNGFITIRLHDNGSINSPLNELDEVDELSEKIIRVVYDFVKDKDL